MAFCSINTSTNCVSIGTWTATDSEGNTYTAGAQTSQGIAFWNFSIAGGTRNTITVNFQGSSGVTFAAFEYIGINATDNGLAGNMNGFGVQTFTTINPNAVIIDFVYQEGPPPAAVDQTTPGMNTRIKQPYANGTGGSIFFADYPVTGAGAYTITTNSSNSSFGQSGQLISFRTNGTVTGGPPAFRAIALSDLPAQSQNIYHKTSTAQVAAISDTTMLATVNSGQWRFTGSINCTTTSAGATATLNLKYTDTANTAQTVSVTDTCTALVTSGVPQITQSIRAKSGTNITWGVTIANTPTYDVSVTLELLGN